MICCASVFCGIDHFQLHQQAFLQVARANAGRIEFLHHGERFLHVFHGVVAGLGDLFERGGQIAVFIEIADDDSAIFRTSSRANAHAQLPGQMVGQAGGEERNLSNEGLSISSRSPLATRSPPVSRYWLEKRAEVEFVEGIGCLRLRELFRFPSSERLRRCSSRWRYALFGNSSRTGFAMIS